MMLKTEIDSLCEKKYIITKGLIVYKINNQYLLYNTIEDIHTGLYNNLYTIDYKFFKVLGKKVHNKSCY